MGLNLEELPFRSPASLRRLSVSEFERMIAAGVFPEDEHVELLDGFLVHMTPQGPRHSGLITRLSHRLSRTLGDEYRVLVQQPLALGERSRPEPDLAVVRAEDAERLDRLPQYALLVVEVADSSAVHDRNKGAIYAHAGVSEYWLIDMKRSRIEVYQKPEDGHYTTLVTLGDGDTLSCVAVPGLSISLTELLH
ncbi:MAG: Uma2 family endonuclease [Myxococcaceae bacterium]|nr:Uma2 family endonuclease [Myxococcaceae bacterium]MCI0673047.1 Uma2 family endonuclease [Myxococcaceae bacterium]